MTRPTAMAPDASTSPLGHTPGDWLLEGKTVYALDERGEVNRFSVLLNGGYEIHSGFQKRRTSEEELLANARLIAAAPELLAAVQMLVDYDDGADIDVYEQVIAAARAAIAKARGEVA